MYEKTRNPFYAVQGLRVLDDSLEKYWQGEYYSENPWTWPEALALSALWKAYAITGEGHYIEKAEKLYEGLNNNFWDEDISLFREFSSSAAWTKSSALSGNLLLAKAFIDGFTFGAGEEKLERAEKLMTGIFKTFYKDGYLRHDARLSGAGSYSLSSSYCSGCNFFALDLVLKMNKIERAYWK